MQLAEYRYIKIKNHLGIKTVQLNCVDENVYSSKYIANPFNIAQSVNILVIQLAEYRYFITWF